jgi:lipopolysaccharide export system permease protein
MSVLSRYLIRHFATILGLVLPGLIGIYLLIEAFEKLDDLIEAKASVTTGLSYFLLSIPRIIFELAPLATMLAGVLSVMLLSRHAEIVALRTLGVKPWRVLSPFLLLAGCLSVGMLAAQTSCIPAATARADALWQVEVKGRHPKGVLQGDRLFYRGEKGIWTTELASPDACQLKKVHWILLDDDFKVRQLVTASEAVYTDGRWTFRNGLLETRTEGDSVLTPRRFDSLSLESAEVPADFVALQRPAAETDLISLWRNVRRLKASGFDAQEQETVLYGQILYPFLGVSLLLLGLPLTLTRRRGGLGTGLGLGLAFGFAAWVSWGFALTLGKTGAVPAILAPSGVHLILAGCGAALIKKMRF